MTKHIFIKKQNVGLSRAALLTCLLSLFILPLEYLQPFNHSDSFSHLINNSVRLVGIALVFLVYFSWQLKRTTLRPLAISIVLLAAAAGFFFNEEPIIRDGLGLLILSFSWCMYLIVQPKSQLGLVSLNNKLRLWAWIGLGMAILPILVKTESINTALSPLLLQMNENLNLNHPWVSWLSVAYLGGFALLAFSNKATVSNAIWLISLLVIEKGLEVFTLPSPTLLISIWVVSVLVLLAMIAIIVKLQGSLQPYTLR